jgi:hypothetical protein
MALTKTTATYIDYSRKYFEYDTVINNLNYKKYRWETFKNSTEDKVINYEYEFVGKDSYSLLDQNLTEAHSFKFDKKPQKGKIFYKEGIILYDFIKGQEFPNGVEVEYDKYTYSDNEYTYVLFDRRDFSVGATSYDKDVRFILQGEKIEMINNALNNVNYSPTPPSFKKIGDKMQYEVWSTVVKFAGKIEFKKEGKELEDPIMLKKNHMKLRIS